MWVIMAGLLFMVQGIPVFGQDLTLSNEDLRIEMRADGGFHLYIRQKPGMLSVLLTESTRDPSLVSDNFAYRAKEWNSINGDEIRVLNGVPIPRESNIYSLVSSIPVSHPLLGQAFHVYIPWVLDYGYEGGRHGEVYVTDGTYFNIRAFSFPYADYRGRFADNPFILQAVQRPPEKPEGDYMEEAEIAFRDIAREGDGIIEYAANPEALITIIETLLKKESGRKVDLVICFDTTGSMGPYIDEGRRSLVSTVTALVPEFEDFRIGMVLYKDYNEEYLTRVIPFTRDLNLFQRNLNAIRARGGGDVPEAVYEAIYDGADKFPWEAESRLIILIGDAPPHPKPRGRITREMVNEATAAKEITVNTILLSR